MIHGSHSFLPHPSLSEIAERGVYSLPWTDRGGEMVLVAVDREGRRAAEAIVYHGADPELIASILWQVLNQTDPHLRLVS